MKILLIPTYFGGISWWRFEVPAAALRAAGHEVTCPSADQLDFNIRNFGTMTNWIAHEMPKHDIVHVGYSPEAEFAITLFKTRDSCGVPVVVDIDDDIDCVPTYNSGWATYHPGSHGQRIAKTQLAHADAITLSTPALAAALGYLNANHTILGNWIHVDDWDHPTPPERKKDKSIRLLITGGNGRYGDWQILRGPLEQVMGQYDGKMGRPLLRLFFLGATPDWVQPWMQDKEDPTTNRCFYIQPTQNVLLFNKIVRYVSPDIIISPTQKNAFNKSKSGLKYLEATLAGAAFLCTDYDTYTIAPKGTCLKCDNTETQWKESLSALIEDGALRAQLVDKARDHVLDSCTIGNHISERITFYQTVIDRRTALANSGANVLGGSPPEQQK